LVLDLLYIRAVQKCRICEMTENAVARSLIAYLIVWGQAHENAFARALESLGASWGKVLPIPKRTLSTSLGSRSSWARAIEHPVQFSNDNPNEASAEPARQDV
jgi:Mn-containing catalase